MKLFWKILDTLFIVTLTVVFIRWYIKGHFGKYFIFFWLWTIFSIVNYIHYQNNKPKHDSTPGYVYWGRNMKNW